VKRPETVGSQLGEERWKKTHTKGGVDKDDRGKGRSPKIRSFERVLNGVTPRTNQFRGNEKRIRRQKVLAWASRKNPDSISVKRVTERKWKIQENTGKILGGFRRPMRREN